ncbi:MAG: hypothetical protein NT069_29985 [Planctomycetota bacterium]|nr:hypothetical protein [Planctomycetota bacterium]
MRTRQLAAVVAALMGLVLFPVAAFAQRKPPVRGGQPARQKSLKWSTAGRRSPL